MTLNSRVTQQILIAFAIGIGLAFVIAGAGIVAQNTLRIAFGPTATSTPKPTASRTATRAATSILAATLTPAITQTPAASSNAPTVEPSRTPKPAVQHLSIDRPVALAAVGNSPSRNYLYGTTRGGDLDVHHGEEFENETGTPLFSVADGTIIVAGNDTQLLCGDNARSMCGRPTESGDGYYGNLVVIQLSRTYRNQRVFALYGHMNSVDVTVGRNVIVGDVLGEIGQTGIALGPHVHFEVRVGMNDYAHTRNPTLWMIPLDGRGALAGRYADAKNVLVQRALIKIYRDDGTYVGETETYSRDQYPAVNSDDEMGENFAFPDLPAGDYVIKVDGTQFAAKARIEEGKLTVVDLGGS